MKVKRYIYFVAIALLASCEKEDTALVLPPPGNLTRVIANIQPDYSKQVYVSLSKNTQVTRNLKDWDLAFESGANGFHIYVNGGKYMFVCHTGAADFTNVDTVGKSWNVDNDHLDDDSTAVGIWLSNNQSNGEVMVIDRGRIFYTGINASQRYKKLRLDEVTATEYHFSYCDLNNSTPVSFTIAKDNNYSLMYFSFDNGGKLVAIAPPKNDWDLVFTHYTHTYYNEPIGSPYRYYLVSGGLSNKWNGVTGMRLIKDSTGYIEYDAINGIQASSYSLSSSADFIGFDWKVVDATFNYSIVPNRYYVLRDQDGFYFKIRFLDFYNQQGQSGSITFDYQRL